MKLSGCFSFPKPPFKHEIVIWESSNPCVTLDRLLIHFCPVKEVENIMISQHFVINKSWHYINSAHSGLLKIPVQGAKIQEVALMMCAGGIQVEMKPQREIHSKNEGWPRWSRSVCATSVVRTSRPIREGKTLIVWPKGDKATLPAEAISNSGRSQQSQSNARVMSNNTAGLI